MTEKTIYKVFLPSGKKISFWFIGNQIEKILDAYNIPYQKGKDKSKLY